MSSIQHTNRRQIVAAVLGPVVAVMAALLVGAAIMTISGQDPVAAYLA